MKKKGNVSALQILTKIKKLEDDLKKKTSFEIRSGKFEKKGGYEKPFDLAKRDRASKEHNPRKEKEHFNFDPPFKEVPTVHLGFSRLDANTSVDYLRVYTKAENVTQKGFDLKIYAWLNTQIYGFCVEWIAYTA